MRSSSALRRQIDIILIHDTAVIDDSAIISENVQIGPYCIIGPNVEIGENTILKSNVVIQGPTKIGSNNKFYQFSVIGEATPDKKYHGEETTLEIGSNNIFREGVTIHRGTIQDKSTTVIGDNNLLMPYVHIAHDCVLGNGNTFANNSGLAGHVVIGNYVTLGGYSLIHQFCSVGDYAFLGMSTGVVMDIPAFVKAAYHPAKVIGLNSIGMSRNGVSDESASLLKKAYKLLYRKGLKLEDSIDKIVMLHEETNDENLKIFINSIKASTRGITR